MTEPQQDRMIVVAAAAEGTPPLVTLVQSEGVSVDVTGAERWLNPDGSVFALVTWEEWPSDGSGWGSTR